MNAARGEIRFQMGERAYPLCLTLGALAEIESALGCQSISELQTRFKQLSAEELTQIMTALLRAGGAAGQALTDAQIRQILPGQASQAIAETFRAALG